MMTRVWLVLVVIFLHGCVSVASSGAQAIYNHQSLQKSANDQYITMRSYQALDIDSDAFKNANVNISTFNRVVLICGQVPEQWQKAEAERLVKKIAGVDEVYNLLTVGKTVTHWERINDTWITTMVKANLIASNDVDATQVKVVTEKRMVYLMGILQPKEAYAAASLASRTDGVQGVVKIFSYVNISKRPV